MSKSGCLSMTKKARILLIDKDSEFAGLIGPALEKIGYLLETAESEAGVLNALRKPFEAVLINPESVQSPCGQLIRSVRECQNGAILLLSDNGLESAEKMGIDTHADDVFLTPRDPGRVLEIIAPSSQHASPMKAPKTPRILIVDDDELFLRMLDGILNSGYNVSGTTSPKTAVEMLREANYDILLTDMMMYEMDGMELVRAALKIRPGIVPIVMTGYASKDILVEAFKEGVCDFLEKPFTAGIVLQRIDRAWQALRTELENRQLLLELRKTNEALRKARDGLEIRVEERTAELVRVNRQLKKELTRRQAMERRISEALDLNRKIISASNLGITAYKLTGECVLANRASARIMGITLKDVMGQNFRKMEGWKKIGLLDAANEAIESGNEKQIEARVKNAYNRKLWLDCRLVPFFSNGVKHLLLVADDITDRKKAEERIKYIALHDSLTGLPNRNLFFDRLELAIRRASRYKTVIGLLYIDLDGFKPINDTFGHDAGDAYLREAASRMLNCIRESDTAARLGGDEFGIILPEMNDRAEAEIVAKRLLRSFSKPIRIAEENEVFGSMSIGIASYPHDGRKADLLLQKADTAMYYVKKNGKNNYHFCE